MCEFASSIVLMVFSDYPEFVCFSENTLVESPDTVWNELNEWKNWYCLRWSVELHGEDLDWLIHWWLEWWWWSRLVLSSCQLQVEAGQLRFDLFLGEDRGSNSSVCRFIDWSRLFIFSSWQVAIPCSFGSVLVSFSWSFSFFSLFLFISFLLFCSWTGVFTLKWGRLSWSWKF